jgi:hypothetical protein
MLASVIRRMILLSGERTSIIRSRNGTCRLYLPALRHVDRRSVLSGIVITHPGWLCRSGKGRGRRSCAAHSNQQQPKRNQNRLAHHTLQEPTIWGTEYTGTRFSRVSAMSELRHGRLPCSLNMRTRGGEKVLRRSICQCRLSASSSSSVRGQSAPKRRERLRSASTLPPVWQRAQ